MVFIFLPFLSEQKKGKEQKRASKAKAASFTSIKERTQGEFYLTHRPKIAVIRLKTSHNDELGEGKKGAKDDLISIRGRIFLLAVNGEKISSHLASDQESCLRGMREKKKISSSSFLAR